jgi:hypothetical protein
MPTLLDLPDELLLLVMNELSDGGCSDRHESSADIPISAFYNLALACPRLNRIAMPYLYSAITNKKSMHALVAVIARFPESAKCVQKIHWSRDSTGNYNLFSATAPRDRLLEKMRLLGLRVSIPHGGSRIVDPLNSMDFLAAALCFTPNIRSLNVYTEQNLMRRNSQNFGFPHWLDVLRAGPSAGYFETLHTVRLQMISLTLGELFPILQLPSLEVLELVDLQQFSANQGISGKYWAICHLRSSSIKELIIHHVAITAEVVSRLLRYIKALRDISFVFSRRNDPNLGCIPPPFYYSTLSRGLLMHKDTLESLDVQLSLKEGHYVARGTLDNLSDFKRITRLQLNMQALVDLSMYDPDFATPLVRLPARVEHISLVVEGRCQSPYTKLQGLARSCTLELKALKTVEIYFSTSQQEYSINFRAEREVLRSLFAEHGVGVQYNDRTSWWD